MTTLNGFYKAKAHYLVPGALEIYLNDFASELATTGYAPLRLMGMPHQSRISEVGWSVVTSQLRMLMTNAL